MEFLESFVAFTNDILWSYVLIVMLVGLGIWFSLRTRFVQVRCLKEMVRLLKEGVGQKTEHNHISSFQAFCVSTASRVGVGNIAGAIVTEGRITKDSIVRITRDKEQIYEGPIATLKHFKDDVKEVKGGSECGMVFENFGQIQEGDLVEAHIMVEVPR